MTDSPSSWVADHIRQYVDSDGVDGHVWQGVPTLLLTTKGRKTGVWRRTALIYGRDNDNYVLVGSVGGAPKHPQWYLNLRAHDQVRVQVGAEKFAARARIATAEEKPHLWATMTSIFPQFDDYQAKTNREIQVIILERTEPADPAR